MKSLFSRLRHNKENVESKRPPSSRTTSQDDARPANTHHASSHTADRPHTPIAAFHSQSSSGSSDSLRPHSIAGDVIYEDETIRARTVSGDGPGVKKVTFRSPVPTPTTSLVLDEMTMFDGEAEAAQIIAQTAPRPTADCSAPQPGPRPPSASSRSTSRQSVPNVPKSIITRKPSLPSSSQPSTSPTKSMLSPTPSEQSLAGMSTKSYLPPPNSWSEMAEDDLIANLGPRERTRQEVLWEIVSSEERYVQELIKLNETFARTLLPPSARSPSLDLFDPAKILSRTLSPALSAHSPLSTAESFDHLPIAAQYSHLTTPPAPVPSQARMQAYHSLTNGRPGDPSREPTTGTINGVGPRSHQSLPPPRRDAGSGSSSASRMSYHPTGRAKGHDGRATSGTSISSIKSAETTLPDSLEKVLSVLAGGILEGHIKLAAALRKRYENQYPLVRSLADVFTAHSYILREYATYVLHLEQALEQVEHALATYTSQPNKRASRRLDETDLGRLGKVLFSLEELAADRGESGLQISLSKPFQRLLKYPLLFQNLLFNTDPSLKEYEATLTMVDEVEEIVRSIEDEKATNEERERTRDVWARIEGLDREKTLMVPKPNRLLVSEVQMDMSETDTKALKDASTKQKKSFRRLSDILKGGETADLWVVRFSDVSLLCERTGMTNLPLSNYKPGRSDSMPEMSGKSRNNTTGRRTHSIKARNLYRFVKIHEWSLKPKTGSSEALLSMEEISRARSVPPSREGPPVQETNNTPSPNPPPESTSPQRPSTVPLKGDGGASPAKSIIRRKGDSDTDTMVSDRLSVMSFAFKGSDQVKPVPKRTRAAEQPPPAGAAEGSPARTFAKSSGSAVYPQRRSTGSHLTGNAANAKFAHRLRPHDAEHEVNGETTVRPISRTRQSLPPSMAHSTKPGRASPVLSPTDRNAARPPWNASTAPASKMKSNPPSIAPSTRESLRGVRGIDTSVTGTGRRVVPKAVAAVKAAEGVQTKPPAGAGTGAGPGARALKPAASTDSSVAGMWNTYREGGATGTPRKVPPRQMGGRI